MAEIELSVLTEQCLDRRIESEVLLVSETNAWMNARNQDRARVVWRFTVADARVRLAHLYPRLSN